MSGGESSGYSCGQCGAVFSRKRQLVGHVAGKHRPHGGVRNSSIVVSSLTHAQLGYLAAFLDGEGGVQITQSERKDREYKLALHPVVYFTNSWRAAIDTLAYWLASKSVVIARAREGRKDLFVLHVTGIKNIMRLLEVLMPYLIVKKERAEVMMEFCESRVLHNRSSDRRYTERELELYTALSRLNERGVKSYQPTVV